MVNRSEMNPSTMKSAPNAAKEPYDLQFLDTMSAHHKGAIVMANMVLTEANHAELKTSRKKLSATKPKKSRK